MTEEKTAKELRKELLILEKQHKKRLTEKDQELEKVKKGYNKTIREYSDKLDKVKCQYEKERTRRKVLEKKIDDHGLRRRVKTEDGYERRGKRKQTKKEPVQEDDDHDYISSE